MKTITRMANPTRYPLQMKNGKAMIVRDFFPTLSSIKLDEEWAANTVSYRPYFVSSALGTDGIVDGNHECGLSNNANIRLWLNQVQNDILGRRYRDCMKIGWNEALAELTKRQTCRVSNKDVSVETDFSYYEKRPVCQEDALKILFGDEVTALVKGGQLEQPFVLLFMWGYYLTMEGCHLD